MALNNTGNPVPSDKGLDLQDNAKTIDEITNSSNLSTATRTGKTISTVKGMEAQYVFTAINNGVWAAGQTFTAVNQFMVFSGTAYKPKNSTTLPYVVGATPVGDANVEVVGNLSTAQGDARYALSFPTLSDATGSSLIQSLTDGTLINTGFNNTPITQVWEKLTSEPADFSDGYYVTGVSSFLQLIDDISNEVQVESTGFDPLGTHANNKTAVELAIQVALESGSATVSYRDYALAFVDCGSGIQLHRGLTLKMNGGNAGGSFNGGLLGDGAAAIFLTGVFVPGGPNTPSLIREITFDHMVATNSGGFPICDAFAPNITVDGGRYAATDSETFKFRFSFRSAVIGAGRHKSTWTSPDPDNYTITAYDNCNGFFVSETTTISGGANGGGVDVSQSQKLNIDGIYETMGNRAIRIAGYTGVERGNCNGVRVAGYMEACEGSISLGKENRVTGCEIGNSFISQAASTSSDFIIEVGKVKGIKAGASVSIVGNGTETAFSFIKGAAGSGLLSTEKAYLEGIPTVTVAADIKVDGSLLNSEKATLFNSGRIQIGDSVATGVSREYVSPTVIANVGISGDNIFQNIIASSGIITKVELLEVQGTLTGAVLRIGDTATVTRNMNLSVDGVGIANGYADITSSLAVSNFRTAEAQTSRVVPGSGTGTFRYKITYKS